VFGQSGDGGTQSPFAGIGVGSRAISLGKAYVSMADDASSIYWNPASLRAVQRKQLMGMYMPLYGDFTDATYTYLGAAYPTLNAGSIGLGFQRVATNFEGFDESSVSTGEEEYSETQILIGWAFERSYGFLFGRLATGLSFKIANQKLASLSSTAPGVDLGFLYRPDFAERLNVGLNFQDLVGPSHKLVSEADDTYRTILFGAGYTFPLKNGSAFRAMLQFDLPEKADTKFHAGVEYLFARYAALRIGLDDSDLSFGLGFVVNAFGFDYAYVSRETAGSSHPVTFTADWGATLSEQRAFLAQERANQDAQLVQEAFNRRVQEHRDLAKQNEVDGNLPVALDEWKIVLEYVPGDEEATRRMAALNAELVAQQTQTTQDIEKQARISTHFTQGLNFYQADEYVRARGEWVAVLAIDSTNTEAQLYLERTQTKIDELLSTHENRAVELENQGRYTEAIGEWNNVQLLDPENAEAPTAIARIQRKIESQSADLEQAAKRLEIVNLYNDALQDFNQGNYQQAITGTERLLKLEPGHEDAKRLQVLAQRKLTPLSKEEEASIRRYYLKGMEYFSKDQYAEAIAEWEKILEIDPTNESVQQNIDEAKERLKQLGSR
jgi:tetratricopeptide (TPR) repeat protein